MIWALLLGINDQWWARLCRQSHAKPSKSPPRMDVLWGPQPSSVPPGLDPAKFTRTPLVHSCVHFFRFIDLFLSICLVHVNSYRFVSLHLMPCHFMSSHFILYHLMSFHFSFMTFIWFTWFLSFLISLISIRCSFQSFIRSFVQSVSQSVIPASFHPFIPFHSLHSFLHSVHFIQSYSKSFHFTAFCFVSFIPWISVAYLFILFIYFIHSITCSSLFSHVFPLSMSFIYVFIQFM